MTAAAEWTDRYEGRAVCPAGHEFVAEWLDTTRAECVCPVCSVVFEAVWPGFSVEPETVIVAANDLATLQIGHKATPSETPGKRRVVSPGGTAAMNRLGMSLACQATADEARSQ